MASSLLTVAVSAVVLSIGPAIVRASSAESDRTSGLPQPQRRYLSAIIASESGALAATGIGLVAAAWLERRRRYSDTPLTPDDCPWCSSGEM